jgi:hypothetical protein
VCKLWLSVDLKALWCSSQQKHEKIDSLGLPLGIHDACLLDEGLEVPNRFCGLFCVELLSRVRTGTLLLCVGLPLSVGFLARRVSLRAVRRLSAVLRTVLDVVLLREVSDEQLKKEGATYPSP